MQAVIIPNNVNETEKQFANVNQKSVHTSCISKMRTKFIESIADDETDFALTRNLVKKQKSILTQENFLRVINKEQLSEQLIDWSIFQTEDVDTIEKISTINFIQAFLSCYYLNYDIQTKQFDDLRMQVYRILQDKTSSDIAIIDKYSLRYFKQIHHHQLCNYEIDSKLDGIHLGTKVTFSTPQIYPQRITYYVKTHFMGLTFHNNLAQQLQLNELLVYKLLQRLKIGEESHFFGKDLRNFFIATKDAGFEHHFLTYECMKSNPQYQEFLQSQVFSTSIIHMDLLSRILCLNDLHPNPNNFGFKKTLNSWNLTIIDFSTPTKTKKHTLRINGSCFREFLNGFNQAKFKDNIVDNVFKQEKYQLEKIARSFFETELKNFHHQVQQSQKIVINQIRKNIHNKQILELQIEKMQKQLSIYIKAIINNYDVFCSEMNIHKHQNQIEI